MMQKRGLRSVFSLVLAFTMLLTSIPVSDQVNADTVDGTSAAAATAASDADLTNLEDFDLSEVLLTDEYYINATNLEIDYLLSLETDRLLANFYQVAGLDNGAECYDGWEDSLIGGHTLGHYMTALAQAYENANSTADQKAQLLTKITELVEGLKECQDAIGTGFIFGSTQYTISTNPEYQFDNVEKNLTNISTQAWVPWYTMHKILAGLISVAELDDSDSKAIAAEALEVASDLGDWVYNRVSGWDATTQACVLSIEYGGMNDALYDLYILTGEENYMTAAHMFDETDLFEKVANASAGDNVLDGLHANTTIPKFLGALKRYTITGEDEYLEYVEAFWTLVVNDHTYVTGGNSEWEHFGADDVLDGERTNCNDETCNVYNMLKMSRLLYQITGEKKYMDYYENTFLNSIMSSQNPETGMTTYFQPMATGYFKVYSSKTDDFWCCTGSGMENFSKLQTSIYYHKDNYLIVNQFVSSEVTFADANAVVTQETDIPNKEETVFTVSAIDSSKEVDLDLALRIPDWAAGDVTILVNGTEYTAAVTSEGYAIVEGLSAGDTVSYTIPMEVVVYTLSDNENVFAFKYGPVVLSAELGTNNMTTGTTGVNVKIPLTKDLGDASSETLVIDTSLGLTQEEFIANINDYLVRDTSAEELSFTLTGTDTELTFSTHYMQYTQRYGLYWTIIADDDAIVSEQVIAQKESDRATATTTDSILIGYGQYESDAVHDMQDSGSIGDTSGTVSAAETYRYVEADGSFAYDMEIGEVGDYYLQAYFLKEDLEKTIQITVGDTVVFAGTVAQLAEKYGADTSEDIFHVEILLSESVVSAAAKTKKVNEGTDSEENVTVITVCFASAADEDSARLCNLLSLRTAYSTNAALANVESADTENVKVSWNGGSEISITVSEGTSSFDLYLTPSDACGYLTIDGYAIDDTKAKTLTVSGRTATYELVVYAEDHETSKTYTVNVLKDYEVDEDVVYFVDCGDYDTSTVSAGDAFGTHNSLTEQVYGEDPVTGYSWGIVDTVSSSLTNGESGTGGVDTDWTWPYEYNSGDGLSKMASNRYTKNQYESGITERYLDYAFELENGTYTVEIGLANPWSCSTNPAIYANLGDANEVTITSNAKVSTAGTVVTGTVTVTDGELTLNFRGSNSSTLAINVAYILITEGTEEAGTGTEAGTETVTLTDSMVTLGTTSYTYDGSAKQPAVTVKNGSTTLVSGTDYKVSYSNNTNAGTATVTVTGQGNYTGTVTKKFTINKASQTISVKSKGSTSVKAGKTTTWKAQTTGDGTITYSSGNTSVATVNSSTGEVTAKAVGTVEIYATAAATSNYNASSKTLIATIQVGLTAPTIKSVVQSGSAVTVKWAKITGAKGYYVYRSTSKNGTYKKVKTITSGSTVSYKDTASKTSGKTYYYKVYAYSGSTKSSASSVKSIKYMKGTISTLTNVTSGIQVKWSKVSGATGYYIYRKASGASKYTLVKKITKGSTVSYTDTKVKSKNGTTYTYYVQPYNSSSKGAYATKKTVRLTAVTISSVKNSASKAITVKISKKNAKATGYQIQYSTSKTFASGKKITVSGASTLSKKITKLTKGKTYYVRVRAYKTVSGTKYYSAWSAKKSVKVSK